MIEPLFCTGFSPNVYFIRKLEKSKDNRIMPLLFSA